MRKWNEYCDTEYRTAGRRKGRFIKREGYEVWSSPAGIVTNKFHDTHVNDYRM